MEGFKCAPQILGLVRENNPSGKHRANGKAIALEMGSERVSRSVITQDYVSPTKLSVNEMGGRQL